MIKCHGHLSKTKDFLWETLNQPQKTKSSNKISKMLRDIDLDTDKGLVVAGVGVGGKQDKIIYSWLGKSQFC